MDGLKSKAATIPIITNDDDFKAIKGQEYLGIYPYVDKVGGTFFVNFLPRGHERLGKWLYGVAV